MRIIIHHRTQGRGVEAVHLLGIAKGFASFNYDVEIVSPPGVRLTSAKQAPKSGSLSRFSKYAPEILFETMEVFNNYSASKKLEELKQRGGCDILYERFALLNYIGAYKAKRWGIKFVVEVNYTTNSPLDIRRRTRIFAGLAKWMERYTFGHANLLMPVSSTLADELRAMGYSDSKILISPNAADPDQFSPGRSDVELKRKLGIHKGITIGYTGGFAPWHSLDVLIEASALIKEHNPGLNLLLIGDGPCMPLIRRLKKRYGDRLNIILPGRIDHKALLNYIELMDIVVMPNSNDYGSPMKIFEYMAMGKPLLAPDYPPVRDVIRDRIDGLIFEPNNMNKLSESIRYLLSNKDLMVTLGRNARHSVVAEHNWKRRVRSITEKLNKHF